LTIGTPDALVVDLGTEFGVTFDEYTEVHVFDGAVEIRPNSGPTGTAEGQQLKAGEAVYVCSPSNGGAPEIGPVPPDSARFTRRLPPSGTVAGSRTLGDESGEN
jgi:ferric-dicitrate binding protein FerR (iron transport regulator)